VAAQKSIAVIIVAGGTGERAGGTPKQYRPLSGKPVRLQVSLRESTLYTWQFK